MPILPLAHWVAAQLGSPFCELGDNPARPAAVKNVWIDMNWADASVG
jgi:hypothetical protein